MKKRQGESWDIIMVQVEEVPLSPREICEFYDIPYYEKDILDSIDLNTFESIDMEDVVK